MDNIPLITSQKRIEYFFQRLENCIEVIKDGGKQLTPYVSDGPPIVSACLMYHDLNLALSVMSKNYSSYERVQQTGWNQQLHQLQSILVATLLDNGRVTELQAYLDEKLKEYGVSLGRVAQMEMEEFWNILNLRSAIEAVLHCLEWVKDINDWRRRVAEKDDELRSHGQKDLLSPFSEKEQVRLLKPKSNWWYYRDFYY